MSGNLTSTCWKILYKNYKGLIEHRNIQILGFDVASTKWHPKQQLLMIVYDLDKKAYRNYATKDIIEWINRI